MTERYVPPSVKEQEDAGLLPREGYHGTAFSGLKTIEPVSAHGIETFPGITNPTRTYFNNMEHETSTDPASSSSEGAAWSWANSAIDRHGGRAVVYKTEAHGTVRHDRNFDTGSGYLTADRQTVKDQIDTPPPHVFPGNVWEDTSGFNNHITGVQGTIPNHDWNVDEKVRVYDTKNKNATPMYAPNRTAFTAPEKVHMTSPQLKGQLGMAL